MTNKSGCAIIITESKGKGSNKMTAIDREILTLKMKSYSDEGLTYEEFQRYCYLQNQKRREQKQWLNAQSAGQPHKSNW